MAEMIYTYSITNDFPNGKLNSTKLVQEINASSIVTALIGVNTRGDVCNILFKAELSAADKTILDGNTTHPAGGLIAAHDNTPSPNEIIPVVFPTPQLVYPKPTSIGKRVTMFSHNFCDRTTWYYCSLPVTDEDMNNGGTMALQRANVSFENGLTAVTTYERIVGITISRSKTGGEASVAANVNLGLWTTKARSDTGNQAVEHSSVALRGAEALPLVTTLTSADILAQAYTAIKVHEPVRGEPDYRAAVNV